MGQIRFPSERSFRAVPDFVDNEMLRVEHFCDPVVDDEFTASLVLWVLRNMNPGETMDVCLEILSLDNTDVGFSNIVCCVLGWSSSEAADFEARWFTESTVFSENPRYVAALVAYYGENVMPLVSVLSSPYIPEFIPLNLLGKFFKARSELRQEGVMLRNKTSLALCLHWSSDDIFGFLRNQETADLEDVLRMRAAGVETVDEITQMREILPPEMLEELFG